MAGVEDAKATLRDRASRTRERALAFSRDAEALTVLRSLPGPFVPWTGMAMRPAAVQRIINEVSVNERQRIVELGAGISTIYLARFLASRGSGSLATVEEDPAWAEIVRRRLKDEGNEDLVTIVHAGLRREGGHGSGDADWYDPDALGALGDEIDLLVVDGPTAWDHPERRYPALP